MLALLTAAGLGVPISEDLTLLLAGALAGQQVTRLWPTLIAGYLGVVLGDLLIYQWGKRLGPAAYQHPRVRKHLSPDRQEKLRAHFRKHGFLTVVVGRHTPQFPAPGGRFQARMRRPISPSDSRAALLGCAPHAALRPACPDRALRRVGVRGPHLRIDLDALPQALPRPRRLRADARPRHLHGRPGVGPLAGRPPRAPTAQAARGVRGRRGEPSRGRARLAPGVRTLPWL